MITPFTAEWADAWGRALGQSAVYREAASAWEGAVALIRRDPPETEPAVVFLDLWHGDCRAARLAEPGDIDAARYILEADRETWEGLLNGTLGPLPALMTGRLRLTRGSLASLLPYAGAARELVATAVAMHGAA
jgi:putative sterol carrier protein